MISEARTRANRKWEGKAYIRLTVRVKKENEELLNERCKALGKTVGQYVNWLIENDIPGFESVGEQTKKGDKRK